MTIPPALPVPSWVVAPTEATTNRDPQKFSRDKGRQQVDLTNLLAAMWIVPMTISPGKILTG